MSFFPPWGLRVQRIGQWNWDQETVSMQWGPVHKRGCLFFFFAADGVGVGGFDTGVLRD